MNKQELSIGDNFSSWEGIFRSPFSSRVQIMPSLESGVSDEKISSDDKPHDADCDVKRFLELELSDLQERTVNNQSSEADFKI